MSIFWARLPHWRIQGRCCDERYGYNSASGEDPKESAKIVFVEQSRWSFALFGTVQSCNRPGVAYAHRNGPDWKHRAADDGCHHRHIGGQCAAVRTSDAWGDGCSPVELAEQAGALLPTAQPPHAGDLLSDPGGVHRLERFAVVLDALDSDRDFARHRIRYS